LSQVFPLFRNFLSSTNWTMSLAATSSPARRLG
jgi:hypothetical protein